MAQHYVELFERLLQRERQGAPDGTRPAVPIPTDRARVAAAIISESATIEDDTPQTA